MIWSDVYLCVFCSAACAIPASYCSIDGGFAEQKRQEVGVKKICISNTENCTDVFGRWTGTQPPPKSPCSVLLPTSWACPANCSKLFKLWSGQKAIFINLTSPSFLVFTVSLGFLPGEPLASLASLRLGPCPLTKAERGLQAPRRVTACRGLRGAVSPLQRWVSGFGEPWACKTLRPVQGTPFCWGPERVRGRRWGTPPAIPTGGSGVLGDGEGLARELSPSHASNVLLKTRYF